MNVRNGTKDPSGYLLPLFKSKAEVIEQSAVGIKPFTTGSKYRNLLGRDVQDLPKLHFLLPDLFLGRLTFGDIGYRPDKLGDSCFIFRCMSHNAAILDRI